MEKDKKIREAQGEKSKTTSRFSNSIKKSLNLF
jgi:hypothetical protein